MLTFVVHKIGSITHRIAAKSINSQLNYW